MADVGGLILAGGLSRRMGQNKPLLPFGPGRLIDRVAARVAPQVESLALNTHGPIDGLDALPRIADAVEGFAGPLAGVLAGLRHLRRVLPQASHLLTVAADTPFFPENLRTALEAEGLPSGCIAVATSADGSWQPTFALWPVTLEEDLDQWLADPGNRKLRAFIARHPHRLARFSADPRLKTGDGQSIDPFFNINTPEDYRQALAVLEARS